MKFLEVLEKQLLFFDGAMGTILQERGLQAGELPETWNLLHPEIILFDEPMSALDVDTRIALRRELKELQKLFGTTMIYITHDQEEAFALSDRVMIMDDARLIQLDTPENIVEQPANEYVRRFVIDNLRAKVDSIRRYVRDDHD